MNYKDQPLQERIQQAAEYAVLLNDEPNKTPSDIIAELSSVFGLTESQATTAYKNSRKVYKDVYQKATVSKTWHYVTVFLVSITVACFYFFIGQGSGFVPFWLLSAFFALAAFGLLTFLIRVMFDRIVLKYPYVAGFRKSTLVSLFPLTLCFFIWSGVTYLRKNIVTEKDLVGAIFQLTQNPEYKKAPGKNGQWRYEFRFKDYADPFYFNKSDLIYASTLPNFTKYQPGDTIIAEVLKTDIINFENYKLVKNDARIYGIWVNGESTIDYQKRFKIIHQNHKNIFTIASLVLLAHILILALLIKNRKDRMLNPVVE